MIYLERLPAGRGGADAYRLFADTTAELSAAMAKVGAPGPILNAGAENECALLSENQGTLLVRAQVIDDQGKLRLFRAKRREPEAFGHVQEAGATPGLEAAPPPEPESEMAESKPRRGVKIKRRDAEA